MKRGEVENIIKTARERMERPNLRGANLRGADLSEADLDYSCCPLGLSLRARWTAGWITKTATSCR